MFPNATREQCLLYSHFVNINPEIPFQRLVELDEPFLIRFEDGDQLEIVSSQPPEWRMTMNAIPKRIAPYVKEPNVDINGLFSPCIGQKIIDVKAVNYPPGVYSDFIACLSDTVTAEHDYIQEIILQLENGTAIKLYPFVDYCYVACTDTNSNPLTLPFRELKELLWLSEEDQFTLENQSYYEDIGYYSEGMCSVSTLYLPIERFAFHSDHADIAGIKGYLNTYGEEVIKPQYIYANEFYGGIAIVAKGKWVNVQTDTDKEPIYKAEHEVWGGIDCCGQEVIPFMFDDIRLFCDTSDYFIAYKWVSSDWLGGVIDRKGNWIVEPQFQWIDYDWNDGLIIFSNCPDAFDSLFGLYDAYSKHVLYEPVYSELDIDNGILKIESYHKDSDKRIVSKIDIKDLR